MACKRRGFRLFCFRHEVQQPRLQIRKRSSERRSADKGAAHHLPMKPKTIHNQTGSTLAVVIITMALLIAVVGVATEYTTTVGRHVRRANSYETALAMGDSCMEIMFSNWRSTYRTMAASSPAPSPYPPSTSSFNAVPTPSPGQFPELTGFASGTITSPFVNRGTTASPTVDDYDSAYTISNYK